MTYFFASSKGMTEFVVSHAPDFFAPSQSPRDLSPGKGISQMLDNLSNFPRLVLQAFGDQNRRLKVPAKKKHGGHHRHAPRNGVSKNESWFRVVVACVEYFNKSRHFYEITPAL